MGYAEAGMLALKLLGGALGLGVLGYSAWRIKKSYDDGVKSKQALEDVVEGQKADDRAEQEHAKRRGGMIARARERLGL